MKEKTTSNLLIHAWRWWFTLHPSALHRERALRLAFASPDDKVFLILTITVLSVALLFLAACILNNALIHTKKLEQAVHEKTQAETALQQSLARYNSLLENIPAITYIVGLEQGLLNPTIYIGPQIEKITGYTSADFFNDALFWTKLMHPDDRVRVLAESERADQTGEPFVSDYRIITKEDNFFWFHDESVLVKDDHGQSLYRLGIWSNITERKQAEAERESVIKELEMRNAELERFTYTVSHDLKSPLVTIKGFLGMLKKDMKENRQDRIQKDFGRIAEAAEKMGALLSELLELSRIGRIVNPPTEVDLEKLVHEALEMLEARIRFSNAIVNVSPDLPSVYGDKIRLREVFENLIDNAAKYMGGQKSPLIEIGTYKKDGEQIIFVKDNGIGIDPQYYVKIFGLFEKLNPDSEGTGVGLALIKRIIEVHGGRLWIESEGLNKGSAFFFTIPDGKTTKPQA